MPRTLPSQPTALLFAPMIYVAWADGDLSHRELDAIATALRAHPDLPAESRELIADWLDPTSAPTAGELVALLERIRSSTTAMPQRTRLDFRSVGRDLAEAAGHAPTEAELAALADLEEAIGIASADRASSLLWPVRPPPITEIAHPSFDVGVLSALLDGERAELRDEVLSLLASLEPRVVPTAAYRAQVHEWLGQLAARGWGLTAMPVAAGGQGDLRSFLTVFETLGFGDLSLLVKFGVQFGLFGLGVAMLGTERHHRELLGRAGALELAGCFAMTETRHGSNVAELETTALFDEVTGEFVIDTPTPRARKDYIGNAANFAHMALVFAQLEASGQRHGVHGFMVPLRDEDGRVLPGVLIEECGDKVGLDGVDNGRISFAQVRVGRDALLDRFAQVAEDGTYTSPIASPGRRFFTMLGTLVGGRVAVASAAVSASKVALTIAVRYANRRRQFGPSGAAELRLIDYPHHRRRLLPRLAKTIALHAAVRDIGARFASVHEQPRGEVPPSDPELETRAAAIKALATWHASDTIGECREACGGRGYLADSRFGALRADTDVFTTFEGDNTVLLQLVAKSLLSDHARGMRDLSAVGLARYVGRRVLDRFDRNPYIVRHVDREHLRDATTQRDLFAAREKDLLHSLAGRIKRRLDSGTGSFEALIECQGHALALARAHAERLALDSMMGLESGAGGAEAAVLARLRSLMALGAMEADRGWFLENGYFEARKAVAIRDEVDALCAELAPSAGHLVDAFDIPDAVLRAPIGLATAPLE